jgi:LuxR family transcriptional regulator, activator of conjugal transfer of Ti plasmids
MTAFLLAVGTDRWTKVRHLKSLADASILGKFVERLFTCADESALRDAMVDVAQAFSLEAFAYLTMPCHPGAKVRLISTYPTAWTARYLRKRYERFDPVIIHAGCRLEPFPWGIDIGPGDLSKSQQILFDEAAQYGIRCGLTIPIRDGNDTLAALTFATDERPGPFRRYVEMHVTTLQLISFYFHAHASRRRGVNRTIGGVRLSPRQLECLRWAAQGKSTWDISKVLGISQRTAEFHLESAKAKLGVRTICQAVARFAAANGIVH